MRTVEVSTISFNIGLLIFNEDNGQPWETEEVALASVVVGVPLAFVFRRKKGVRERLLVRRVEGDRED